MATKNYDVIVIGAGPGGYVAAIRCAQLGLVTACIDNWSNDDDKPAPGGTCLNVGCIPSKSLLESTHHFSVIKNNAASHGISISGAKMNVAKMIQRKNKIVDNMNQGIIGLLKKNKVVLLHGHGQIKFRDNSEHYHVEIDPCSSEDKEIYMITGRHIIIATGSKPKPIQYATIDHDKIVDSTGALAFNDVPKKLCIIGAGAIGLELGSIWSRLGAEIFILEAASSFLEPVDKQLSEQAYKIMSKQGLDIKLGIKITGTGSNNQEVIIKYEDAGGKQQVSANKLIIAAGRKPNTDYLFSKDCVLDLDDNGFIKIDAQYRTSQPDIYAIGDVIRGPMLAHKASEEGVAVAEHIASHRSIRINHQTIPWIIYTWPEIAWVGMTEQTLQEKDINYKAGTFPFIANGRAKTMGFTEGMVKILADRKTDKILGVHILAPNASELIAEAVLAMKFDASSEDIARTTHSHPSLSEALHEATLAVDDRVIHI